MAGKESAWDKWVAEELKYERALDFLPDEEKMVEGILENLKATGEENKWDGLTKEYKLMLLRGLRFRKHPVRDMSKLVRDIVKFRLDNNMDKSLSELWSNHNVYWSAWPSYVAGQDKYGHWINYESVGEMSVKTLDLISSEECVMMRCQYYEAQMEMKRRISKNMGMRTNKFVYIFDLKDLSFGKHFTLKVQKTIQPLLEVCGDMYPDVLWNMFIINSPVTFSMIWRVISPWVDKDVKPKIHILRGPSQYLSRMQKCGIPIDAIPKQIGGKCELVSMRDVIENMVENPESDEDYLAHHHPELPSGGEVNILADDADAAAKREAALAAEQAKAKQDAEKDEKDEEEEELFKEGEVIMEGYLSKRGVLNSDWKRRYFILTPESMMYFTGDPREEDSTLKGKIELFMVSGVKRSVPQAGETLGEFEVATPFRIYNIRVDDGTNDEKIEKMKDWVSAINEAAQEEACTLNFKNGGSVGVNHIRSGFLKKRGVFNTMYKKRYFVLTSSGFYYFNGDPTNPKTVIKGKIRLTNVKKVEKSKQQGAFDIHTKYRVFHMKAKDEADQEAWIQTLRETIDKAKAAVSRVSEAEDDIRNIPYMDKVAVIEAENSFDGIGSFQKNISGFVRRAINLAAGLNMITNSETGEKMRGDEAGVSDIMNMAADRMKNMLGYVYEITVGTGDGSTEEDEDDYL
mmetsp:Transcript_22793/g.29088  ORF Transcript_22793/g.29088 Transcript_22793/m.29088 type:complete len:686 (-) Transcript_22793:86-2143(-)|eukprot:CAMPEP_0204874262 /NCGR_PEP_ID=MMETSP1348-20121228/42680_1 /ASSEMBLY_ACC=CAM_ASM_000700 /TAXON_ID=215587 /ORGANISM="Aplanochytrium stocchinoi, Strain GSBS06" /LENGTH=685 /DNA_ID=CAMNT_0052029985 /DNA_START=47 /DNA_END=2104 /DNA_ORIENTATION=+